MRSTDERIAAVQARSRTLRRRTAQRRGYVLSGISTIACVAAIFGFAFYIPSVSGSAPTATLGTSGAYGSILASGGMLGYVVIGILAFCLGVALTLLCVKIRDRLREDADEVVFAREGNSDPDVGEDNAL
ncbi:MAG: hypothetical protein Q4D34_00165 [Eggerthellaceae bacterium]|nr:hypothetical protein [Eggerthellaceae bacterium]